MEKFQSFYFGEHSLQLIYIDIDNLEEKEQERYFEVIENFKPNKDYNYLDFDYEAEGGICNYYIDGGFEQICIRELVTEIQELIEYLNKNKIEWEGSREGVTLEKHDNSIIPGIICISKNEIMFISCNREGEIKKQTYPICKIKL